MGEAADDAKGGGLIILDFPPTGDKRDYTKLTRNASKTKSHSEPAFHRLFLASSHRLTSRQEFSVFHLCWTQTRFVKTEEDGAHFQSLSSKVFRVFHRSSCVKNEIRQLERENLILPPLSIAHFLLIAVWSSGFRKLHKLSDTAAINPTWIRRQWGEFRCC